MIKIKKCGKIGATFFVMILFLMSSMTSVNSRLNFDQIKEQPVFDEENFVLGDLVNEVLDEYEQITAHNGADIVFKSYTSTLERDPNIVYYIPGEVIIGFKDNVNVANLKTFDGYHIINKIEELNTALIKVEKGKEKDFIDNVEKRDDVFFAEHNIIRYLFYEPNDPYWQYQWGPKIIGCPSAWDGEKGSKNVALTILDTGVDYNHEDLKENYDSSGSFDFADIDNDPMDDYGHGTHCAGIAAAVMDNNKGIAGIAQVSIRAVDIFYWDGLYLVSDPFVASLGIVYAANRGSRIISMSFGSILPSILEMLACNYAYHFRNTLLVAASGNDGTFPVGYPAGYSTVIAVGAINSAKKRCGFSNYGNQLEFVAPGENIYSAILNNKYESWDGTSMATPHVAGVAALLMSKCPLRTSKWIRRQLRQSADDLGTPGKDEYYGYGLVNASRVISQQSVQIKTEASKSTHSNCEYINKLVQKAIHKQSTIS